MNLDALLAQAIPHIIGVWRYRLTALLVMTGVVFLTTFYVLTLPSEYVASAKVYVDTKNLLRPLLSGLTVNDDVLSDVQLMTRALKSRPQLETLARQSDLDVFATTPLAYERLITSLGESIDIKADRQNVYEISYRDTSRERAFEVAGNLLDNFVEDTLGSGRQDSEQAEVALRREIDDYERRLTEAEQRLKDFKQRNVGLMPDVQGDYYAQLEAAMVDLEAAERELRMTNRRARALRAQIEGEEPVFGIMSPTSSSIESSYDLEIATLRERIANLLVEYTEKHPEVLRAQRNLNIALEAREKEIQSRPIPINPSTGNLDLNPIYQSLRIQLNDTEVEIASHNATITEQRERVKRLRELVDVVPEVEANLNRLNRDYEVVNRRYQDMLGRWEALQTSKRVNTGTNSVQFRIIEPTFAASEPVGPARNLFIIAGLLFSIAAGVGVAVVLHLMNPCYHTVSHIQTSFPDLPVVGGVTVVLGEAVRKRALLRTRLLFSFAILVIVGTLTLSFVAEAPAQIMQNLLASL